MRVAGWLVPLLAVVIVLVIGALTFFGLLVGLNGVSEAVGARLLILYLILLLVILLFTGWASRRFLQALTARLQWPRWLQGLLATILASGSAVALLLIGSFALLLFGVR